MLTPTWLCSPGHPQKPNVQEDRPRIWGRPPPLRFLQCCPHLPHSRVETRVKTTSTTTTIGISNAIRRPPILDQRKTTVEVQVRSGSVESTLTHTSDPSTLGVARRRLISSVATGRAVYPDGVARRGNLNASSCRRCTHPCPRRDTTPTRPTCRTIGVRGSDTIITLSIPR
jgi:hypothetical protein